MNISNPVFISFLKSFWHQERIRRLGSSLVKKSRCLRFLKKNSPLNYQKRNSLYLSIHFLNQKGFSLIAPMLITLIFSIGILYTTKALRENSVIKERSEVFLCLKQVEFSRRGYIGTMSRFNNLIRFAFALKFIPASAPYAQKMAQAFKGFQQFYHFSHLKKSLGFNFCSSINALNYLNNLPYKTKAKITLVRSFNGTVPLKKRTWSEYIWSKKRRIILKIDYSLKDRYTSSTTVKRREYSRQALLSSKLLSGAPFFSSSQQAF